jgi:catalase
MRTAERFRAGAGRLAADLVFAALAPTSVAAQAAGRETPLSMVEALHAAFGEHHDRAVHTKGAVFEGLSRRRRKLTA